MANVIPMAGLGSRYSKEGYKLPKPLIPVSGEPMISRAIRDMPESDKWIFIVREEHIHLFDMDRVIRERIPEAVLIPVEETTEGQACSCLLARECLDPDEPLFIASCDNGFLYDMEEYKRLTCDPEIDCVVWTFTGRKTLERNPNAWGWCRLEGDQKTIEGMSIKKPITDNPINDHAVVGSFYFRRAGDYIDAMDAMIRENYRINDEFYVDSVPVYLKKAGKRSVIFDVELYIGWGTPGDLYDYQLMEHVCRSGGSGGSLADEEKRFLPLWRKYFEGK